MMKEKKKNSFKGKVISSADKQRESRSGKGYLNVPRGVKLFKFPEGARSFKLDFVPYVVSNERHLERDEELGVAVPGSIWYRAPIKIHKNIGSEGDTVVCPRTIGKKCPICEYQLKRIKEGADKEEYKVLYPQERSLYAVIPVGHKDYDEVVHVWDISDFLFQETLVDELREDEDNEDFFLLNNGQTASLRLKWKEIGNNSFPEVVSVSFLEREPYEEELLDEVPDLDAMIKVLSYEELFNKFHYGETEIEKEETPEGEPEEEEPPRRRSRRTAEKEEPAPTRRRRAKEEEPEPEAEPEPEPEAEPEPRTRTRKSAVKEEPAPTRRRSVKKEDDDDERCPHGHVFGVDTDEYKECEKCKIWDDCIDEKEKK